MNTLNFNIARLLIPFVVLSVLISGCNSPKKLAKALDKTSIKADPEVLTVDGDSVTINVRIKIPPKTFNKHAIVKFVPTLKYGDQSKDLEPVILKGEKAKTTETASKTINYKTGGSFTYFKRIEYTPDMKNTILSIDYNVKMVSKYEELNQCMGGKTDTIIGDITTSLSVKRLDDIYLSERTVGANHTTRTVVFYFELNDPELGHHIYKGEDAKEKAERIREENSVKERNDKALIQLEDFLSNKKVKIDDIVLKGYASPDGEVKQNANLCFDRTKNGEAKVKEEFKKFELPQINDSGLIKRPDKDEDWNGLKAMVSQSNIDGKADILAIINDNRTYDEKNAALKKLPSWIPLSHDILPLLRRTEVIMHGTFPAKSLDEIKKTPMDSLTHSELLILAKNTPDTAGKLRIFKYFMDKYPNDWAGKNNYASLMMMQGGHDQEAYTMFSDLAKQYPNNDTIQNNLGVANRYLRHYDAAKDNYTGAEKGGLNEKNNLGILYIKYGQYSKATDEFSKDACNYNTALGYCLSADYDAALKKIDCIDPSKKTADVFYLKAIVYARQKDKDDMNTALTRAIQMDPSIRDRAKNDLEFRKYAKTPEFQNVIK